MNDCPGLGESSLVSWIYRLVHHRGPPAGCPPLRLGRIQPLLRCALADPRRLVSLRLPRITIPYPHQDGYFAPTTQGTLTALGLGLIAGSLYCHKTFRRRHSVSVSSHTLHCSNSVVYDPQLPILLLRTQEATGCGWRHVRYLFPQPAHCICWGALHASADGPGGVGPSSFRPYWVPGHLTSCSVAIERGSVTKAALGDGLEPSGASQFLQ